MTAWTNSAITKVHWDKTFKKRLLHYVIAGVSGDAGGTLTCTQTPLNVFVSVSTASAAAAALTWCIVGKTVILTYTNPAAAHTVKISTLC